MARTRKMRGRRAAAVLIAAAGLASAGCGGGSPSDQVKSTISGYYMAFAAGDGSTACAQLSNATRTALERSAGGRKCADAVSQVAKQPSFAAVRSSIKQAKVQGVKITGSSATANVSLHGATIPVSLLKEGGAWKIRSSSSAGG